MSEQIISYGGSVERSTDGITYTSIPEVKSVAIPAITQEYPEVTSLDSPNGFREYIKGLKDAGEIEVGAGYTADGYEQQVADNAEDEAIYYRVTLKKQPSQAVSGDVFTFRGFPTAKPEATDVGGIVEMPITIRVTGDVTWVRGS